MADGTRFVTPGMSHVRGATGKPLLERTIGQELDKALAEAPDDVFIIDHPQRVRLTFAETARRARALAASLQRLGLREGDRIGIWTGNRWEWVVTQMAAALAGLVLVNVNPAYRSSEMHHAANLVGLRALVLQATLKTSNYHTILKNAGDIPTLEFVIEVGASVAPGCISFESLWTDTGNTFAAPPINPDDACNVQFTSGTTGHPKGATLSHRNILNNGYFFGQGLKLMPRDVIICPVPLYHCFGCVLGVLAGLVHRCTVVLPGEFFTADASLECIEAYGGTIFYGVPTMHLDVHTQYTTKMRHRNISSLRGGAMGGSPCPSELMRRMIDDMNMRDIACGYGMTETSPVSFSTDVDDPLDLRCNTVGRVLDHLEVKIVDQTTRAICPIGAVGELCTHGYSVMLGYWAQDDKTRESITEDKFMLTGDLATIDAHGYCRIVGRSKDMIIRGGENVFPAEVENYLMKMPGVQDVSVIGVPDTRMGEEVCAWIRPKAGVVISAKDVHDFCKGQIAHYKVPRYVYNRPEFPLTVTGKVQKNVMREQTAGWLKSGDVGITGAPQSNP